MIALDFQSAESLRHKISTRCKLSHLRVVLEVARHESISRAADSLHLAQPAVTKKLREVETILGTPLFERLPRAVVPNSFGLIVLPHIEAMFSELDRIGDDLTAVRNGLTGAISVGGTMIVLPHLLPQCLISLQRSQPGMVIRVVEGTIDQMRRSLAQNEVDLVLGRVLTMPARYDFTNEILFDDPFVPVVSMRHPVASAEDPTRAMSNYGWIVPPEGSSAREPVERYMSRNRIRPRQRTIETVSFQVTMALLQETDAIAVLPLHLARIGEARRAIKIVGAEIGGGSLPIGLTYRSDRPLPPLAQALIAAFREAIALLPSSPSLATGF